MLISRALWLLPPLLALAACARQPGGDRSGPTPSAPDATTLPDRAHRPEAPPRPAPPDPVEAAAAAPDLRSAIVKPPIPGQQRPGGDSCAPTR